MTDWSVGEAVTSEGEAVTSEGEAVMSDGTLAFSSLPGGPLPGLMRLEAGMFARTGSWDFCSSGCKITQYRHLQLLCYMTHALCNMAHALCTWPW